MGEWESERQGEIERGRGGRKEMGKGRERERERERERVEHQVREEGVQTTEWGGFVNFGAMVTPQFGLETVAPTDEQQKLHV